MTKATRKLAEALFEAYGSRDPVRMTDFMADDMEWRVTGPVELLAFCGIWRGKAAIRQMLGERVPEMYSERTMAQEMMLVDGDRAAAFGRLVAVQRGTGRRISYSLAHFVQFRDGKALSMRSLVDSFDAAEQIIGRTIDISAGGRATRPVDNLVAV